MSQAVAHGQQLKQQARMLSSAGLLFMGKWQTLPVAMSAQVRK